MPRERDLSSVGARLRYVRGELLGMTTKQLATGLKESGAVRGASDASISRYESDDRSPRVEFVVAVAAMAHVSPAWIAEGGYRVDGVLLVCAPEEMPLGLVADRSEELREEPPARADEMVIPLIATAARIRGLWITQEVARQHHTDSLHAAVGAVRGLAEYQGLAKRRWDQDLAQLEALGLFHPEQVPPWTDEQLQRIRADLSA